jgi:hypothetical protein
MPLAHLSLISKGIPAKVNSATTEVTGDALHEVKKSATKPMKATIFAIPAPEMALKATTPLGIFLLYGFSKQRPHRFTRCIANMIHASYFNIPIQ